MVRFLLRSLLRCATPTSKQAAHPRRQLQAVTADLVAERKAEAAAKLQQWRLQQEELLTVAADDLSGDGGVVRRVLQASKDGALAPQNGLEVVVEYSGYLPSGKRFDKS